MQLAISEVLLAGNASDLHPVERIEIGTARAGAQSRKDRRQLGCQLCNRRAFRLVMTRNNQADPECLSLQAAMKAGFSGHEYVTPLLGGCTRKLASSSAGHRHLLHQLIAPASVVELRCFEQALYLCSELVQRGW